jgi:hypothetical protein
MCKDDYTRLKNRAIEMACDDLKKIRPDIARAFDTVRDSFTRVHRELQAGRLGLFRRFNGPVRAPAKRSAAK